MVSIFSRMGRRSSYSGLNFADRASSSLSTASATATPPSPPFSHTSHSSTSTPSAAHSDRTASSSSSVSPRNRLSATTAGTPYFFTLRMWRRRLAEPRCTAAGSAAPSRSFGTPPCILSARTVATMTAASGCSPAIRHLMSKNSSDIKCRMAGLHPEAAVIVATVRALKMHGGVPKDRLGAADPAAVQRGSANLRRHIRNVKKYGVPAVVALNRFLGDTEDELDAVRSECAAEGVDVELCEVWEKGGEGGVAVADAVLKLLDARSAKFKPLYDERRPIREKIETIAREIYGAGGVAFAPPAERALEQLPALGLGETPVCMAKTQYSFSDDPAKLGAPSGFTLQVRDILPSAGAGFVVALAGDIMTMPGLSKSPAAERIRVHPDGTIEGLF